MSRNIIVHPAKKISGKIKVSGDKSISHRAIFLGSLAEGLSEIENLCAGEDCLRSISAFRNLGVDIKNTDNCGLKIYGRGIYGLSQPKKPLDLGNSGTTARLLLGVLAGQNFYTVIIGDGSLQKRPMGRVTLPLEKMGAKIIGREKGNFLPLVIKGGEIDSIDYKSPVASAQVKSALLLAGLYSEGETWIEEPFKSRDHTERMLSFFGTNLQIQGRRVGLRGKPDLKGKKISVPGDISVGAFFIAAAGLISGASIEIEEIGLNPTRSGVIEAFKNMGMDIKVHIKSEDFEPRGSIIVKGSRLKQIIVKGEIIPRLIDEIPILLVASTQAEGRTIFENIGELRIKETDRIHSMSSNLRKMGAKIKEENNRLVIMGPTPLKGAVVESFGDHRTAMSMIVAGLIAQGETTVLNTDCINTSTPSFWTKMRELAVF